MGDEPGVEAPGSGARDAEQQAHDALLALRTTVDALVADGEPAVAGLALCECAARLERREEITQLCLGAPPGLRLVRLEHHTARAALDAVEYEERQAPRGER